MKNVVHLADCMDIMREMPDSSVDLCIVDAPYGREQDGGCHRKHMVKQKDGSRLYVEGPKHERKTWDKKPPDDEFFDELIRISLGQIVFGENYVSSGVGPERIIWDKCNDGSDQSGAEIIACSFTDKVDVFRFMWRGMCQGKSITEGHIQQGNKARNEKLIHPTQKPVALYKWLLQKYAKPGQTIFDSHVGSGSIRIACHDLGYDFEGCEIDRDYWEAQEKRYKIHVAQATLFEPEELRQPEQAGLFMEDL